ncbi:MAG: dihydroorotate dehydrogenase electron transfer subunit [Gammaproteobacteria bacterium]|jgi:dihydroorotate dehydrogenase electron transfer subunit
MGALNLVAKIITNEMIAKNHFVMRIKAPEIAKLAIPGQIVTVKAHVRNYDPLIKIPLGVHKKHVDGISVLYNVVGVGTEILSKLKTDDEIDILGPLGNGFNVTEHKNNSLIAGGFGVAPLYALAEELIQQQKNVAVFLGARTKDLLVCVDDLKNLGATVYIATEDGSRGEKCLVTELLSKHLMENMMLYACGPNPMLKAVVRVAREHKIPAQVTMEAYIACGIGACRGCAIETNEGYKMCCQDGPVFDVGDV